jgi:iron complex outermembrane receptor protein
VNCTTFAAFCAAHGGNAYATGQYNLGLTQTGNPALEPEKSNSFTAGIVVEPLSNVSLTIDFWRIKVDGLIAGVTNTALAESQYYSNNGVVNIPGFTVLPGTPDTAFPNALPVAGFIQSSYTNQSSEVVSGIDVGANVTVPFGGIYKWRSAFDASYLGKYELTDTDGIVFDYAGTLSPCNITSCSGAPKLRASWQNTIERGNTSVSLTAYYTGGYDTASLDFGGVKGDCQGNADIASSTQAYADGTPVLCNAKATYNVDMTIRQKFGERYTVYADILNAFDIKAPFEPSAAYSLFQFNPTWAGPNILGRYIRVGAKANF